MCQSPLKVTFKVASKVRSQKSGFGKAGMFSDKMLSMPNFPPNLMVMLVSFVFSRETTTSTLSQNWMSLAENVL